MTNKTIEDINAFVVKWVSNQGIWNADISYKTLWVVEFEDFLKWYDSENLKEKIFIKLEKYFEHDRLRVPPMFEINWINIDFQYYWYEYVRWKITVKTFLYLYYHYIFWIDVYGVLEYIHEGNNHYSNFYISNSFYINKMFEWNNDYVKIIENSYHDITPSLIENNIKVLWWTDNYNKLRKYEEKWEGKKMITYEKEWKINTTFYPIIIWTSDKYELDNIKKMFSKILPNSEYDEKEENNNKSILKSCEIFDYFVATSKRKSQNPNNEKIKEEIFKLWKENSISDEEIERGISFVNIFLSSIL